jgi:predicted DNA repair protein MutK
MAGASLLTLLDDIASVLDDIALLTKVATKKTAGVLGDDLALNAEQVSGVASERELPVVLAVARGSVVNKLILVPAALGISAVAPWLVTPLLMIGGLFLCYEGFEKVAHKLWHAPVKDEPLPHQPSSAVAEAAVDPVAFEKAKIRGAVRTDFVLSAEIVVIALGTVATEPFVTRLGVLAAIAALMTVGVYGLVAAIVKLDDVGLSWSRREGLTRRLGLGLLAAAPLLMRALGIAGTAAMFLVGGGIVVHSLAPLHHLVEDLVRPCGSLQGLAEALANAVVGIVAGGAAVAFASTAKALSRGR